MLRQVFLTPKIGDLSEIAASLIYQARVLDYFGSLQVLRELPE